MFIINIIIYILYNEFLKYLYMFVLKEICMRDKKRHYCISCNFLSYLYKLSFPLW